MQTSSLPSILRAAMGSFLRGGASGIRPWRASKADRDGNLPSWVRWRMAAAQQWSALLKRHPGGIRSRLGKPALLPKRRAMGSLRGGVALINLAWRCHEQDDEGNGVVTLLQRVGIGVRRARNLALV